MDVNVLSIRFAPSLPQPEVARNCQILFSFQFSRQVGHHFFSCRLRRTKLHPAFPKYSYHSYVNDVQYWRSSFAFLQLSACCLSSCFPLPKLAQEQSIHVPRYMYGRNVSRNCIPRSLTFSSASPNSPLVSSHHTSA